LNGRPSFCPRATARALPSPVRARIRSRSNSASPPRTVSINLPCDVVVSARVSPRDLKPAFLAVMAASAFNRPAGRSRQPVKPRYHHDVTGGRFRRGADEAAVGRGSARHFAKQLVRAGRAKLADLRVNALAIRRDAGIAVNRDMEFCDGARSALVSGLGGEGVGLRHGVFDATDLRNAQALGLSKLPRCSTSLD
jgi:hypothetical protein